MDTLERTLIVLVSLVLIGLTASAAAPLASTWTGYAQQPFDPASPGVQVYSGAALGLGSHLYAVAVLGAVRVHVWSGAIRYAWPPLEAGCAVSLGHGSYFLGPCATVSTVEADGVEQLNFTVATLPVGASLVASGYNLSRTPPVEVGKYCQAGFGGVVAEVNSTVYAESTGTAETCVTLFLSQVVLSPLSR